MYAIRSYYDSHRYQKIFIFLIRYNSCTRLCRITSYNVCYTKLLRNVQLHIGMSPFGISRWISSIGMPSAPGGGDFPQTLLEKSPFPARQKGSLLLHLRRKIGRVNHMPDLLHSVPAGISPNLVPRPVVEGVAPESGLFLAVFARNRSEIPSYNFV